MEHDLNKISPEREKIYQKSKSIVIKVGSSLLVQDKLGAIKKKWFASFIEDVIDLRKKGKTVIIIINLIRCEVATWLKSVFSSSANIISGPRAPGAAEKIDVFFSYLENFSKYFETIRTLKII